MKNPLLRESMGSWFCLAPEPQIQCSTADFRQGVLRTHQKPSMFSLVQNRFNISLSLWSLWSLRSWLFISISISYAMVEIMDVSSGANWLAPPRRRVPAKVDLRNYMTTAAWRTAVSGRWWSQQGVSIGIRRDGAWNVNLSGVPWDF